MITLFNYESQRQAILFEKAWKYLYEHGDLTDNDTEAATRYGKNTFSDLQHYFAYLPELIEHKPLYLMLPIDEEPFEINANTREIEVPPSFQQCSGVQSDNYAEIVTFIIDRYFDYKDLAEAKIAVQWKNGKKEGVSFIELIDLETYGDENKIRFGWPITAEMTETPGDLRFAVRFYTAEERGGSLNFHYLLNTTVKSIPIKPTLIVDLNQEGVITKNHDYEFFLDSVIRSDNPSYAIPSAVVFRDAPESIEAIREDNMLDLYAEAITADGNNITYEWYRITPGYSEYSPEGKWPERRPANVFYEKNDQYQAGSEDPEKKDEYIEFTKAWPDTPVDSLYIKNKVSKIQDDDDFKIIQEFEEYNPDSWPTTRPGDTCFWVEDGTIPLGYKKYPLSAAWPLDISKADEEKMEAELGKDVLTTDEITLYTYKTVLHFNASDKDITGQYFVRGINANDVNSVHTDAPANYCSILAPAPLTITQDLPSGQFLSDSKTLTFIVNTDQGQPKRTYTLFKGGVEVTPLDKTITDNKVEFTLKDGEFGEYYIKVYVDLNRSNETKFSQHCWVSDDPKVPEGDMIVNSTTISDDGGKQDKIIVNEDTETRAYWFNEMVAISSKELGEDIILQVVPTGFSGYNEGTISYSWKRIAPDNIEETITKPSGPFGDIVETEVPDRPGALKIQTTDVQGNKYVCTITNTISLGENNTKTEDSEFTFILV